MALGASTRIEDLPTPFGCVASCIETASATWFEHGPRPGVARLRRRPRALRTGGHRGTPSHRRWPGRFDPACPGCGTRRQNHLRPPGRPDRAPASPPTVTLRRRWNRRGSQICSVDRFMPTSHYERCATSFLATPRTGPVRQLPPAHREDPKTLGGSPAGHRDRRHRRQD